MIDQELSGEIYKIETLFKKAFDRARDKNIDWHLLSCDIGYPTLLIDFQIESRNFSIHSLFNTEKNNGFSELLKVLIDVTGDSTIALWPGAPYGEIEFFNLVELEKDNNLYPFMVGFTDSAISSILSKDK